MKNTIKIVSLLFVFLIVLSACQSNSHKKRKSCNGKGGWYGNRNL